MLDREGTLLLRGAGAFCDRHPGSRTAAIPRGRSSVRRAPRRWLLRRSPARSALVEGSPRSTRAVHAGTAQHVGLASSSEGGERRRSRRGSPPSCARRWLSTLPGRAWPSGVASGAGCRRTVGALVDRGRRKALRPAHARARFVQWAPVPLAGRWLRVGVREEPFLLLASKSLKARNLCCPGRGAEPVGVAEAFSACPDGCQAAPRGCLRRSRSAHNNNAERSADGRRGGQRATPSIRCSEATSAPGRRRQGASSDMAEVSRLPRLRRLHVLAVFARRRLAAVSFRRSRRQRSSSARQMPSFVRLLLDSSSSSHPSSPRRRAAP